MDLCSLLRKLCSSSFSSSHGGIHRQDVFQGDATFQGQVEPPSCAVKQCMACDGEKACVGGTDRQTAFYWRGRAAGLGMKPGFADICSIVSLES